MSTFDFEDLRFSSDIGPLELVQPYAERIIEEPEFIATQELTDYERETLLALYTYAGALGLIGREYLVTASDVIYIPPDDDVGVYLPEGLNEFTGRMAAYDIKKIDQPELLTLYAVGVYLEGVRVSRGDDEDTIQLLSRGGEGELFAPVMPLNSVERMVPRF